MISRRDFLQASMAASAIVGASGFGQWGRLAAQQRLTQDQLLDFDPLGNVTLIHITDLHAQMKPIWFREPEINIGMGIALGVAIGAGIDSSCNNCKQSQPKAEKEPTSPLES